MHTGRIRFIGSLLISLGTILSIASAVVWYNAAETQSDGAPAGPVVRALTIMLFLGGALLATLGAMLRRRAALTAAHQDELAHASNDER